MQEKYLKRLGSMEFATRSMLAQVSEVNSYDKIDSLVLSLPLFKLHLSSDH